MLTEVKKWTTEERTRSWRHLWVLPLVSAMCIPGGFIMTYGISAGLAHIRHPFPMVSETGMQKPERFIFIALMCCGSVTIFLTSLARFHQLKAKVAQNPIKAFPRKIFHFFNQAAIPLSLTMALGLTMVAVDPDGKVHLTGSAMVFIAGISYGICQTVLGYMAPVSKLANHYRAAAVGIAACCCISIFAALPLTAFIPQLADKNLDELTFMVYGGNYNATNSWHLLQMLASISEWGMTVTHGIVMLTLSADFRGTYIEIPKIFIVTDSAAPKHPQLSPKKIEAKSSNLGAQNSELINSKLNDNTSLPKTNSCMKSLGSQGT